MSTESAQLKLVFVLHGHLPYVLGHGMWPHGAEWLFEAAEECYLPLLAQLRRRRGRPTGVTLGVTPVLAEMLGDPRFVRGLDAHLARRTAAAEDDRRAFDADDELRAFVPLARRAAQHARDARAQFHDVEGGDLLASLRACEEAGSVELMGGPATHPFLPLLEPAEVRAQLRVGLDAHARHFGRRPRGLWLPECGYRPAGVTTTGTGRLVVRSRGLEEFLHDEGVAWTVVDGGVFDDGGDLQVVGSGSWRTPDVRTPRTSGSASGATGSSRIAETPWRVGESPVVAFVRDPDTAERVWAAEVGYPGDAAFLEFHKRRDPGGHRYWRITDGGADLSGRAPYDPEAARQRVAVHADDFVQRLVGRAHPAEPVICAPYDAELFGHWWHEGPAWLGAVLERLDAVGAVEVTTPSRWLDQRGAPPASRPARCGSWGEGGDDRVWRGDHADDLWRSIEHLGARLRAWCARGDASSFEGRVQRQAMRSLFLLHASDWPFLIHQGTAVDYAQRRIEGHQRDLQRLLHEGEAVSIEWLGALERRDAAFPSLGVSAFEG